MMRTKLFRSFLIVILASLLASFSFQWLIIKDFDDYTSGIKRDQFRWIRTSLESSYLHGKWDKRALIETIHWAMMLGMDMAVYDSQGLKIISSQTVMDSLSEVMKHQMTELYQQPPMEEKYDRQILYSKNQKIGILFSRQLPKKEIIKKEFVFKKRIRTFLYVSVLIAGLGAFLLALIFSRYLSKPLTDLKNTAEKIAGGDFNVRIPLMLDHQPDTGMGGNKRKRNDPDEIAKLSGTFNFMAASLQKEEELRKHLLSNITHELRTPLTIMKTHLEAMVDGVVTDQEKGLEVIRDETEKLIKLIKGIEDITVAEASFFKKTQKVDINLKEFLSGLVEGMAPVAREKNLSLKMIKDFDLFISTDVEKLEIIIQNILSNALKFTERGGIEIDFEKEGKSFCIKIRDTGKGIPKEKIDFIFNRFYQVEPANPLGFGIGLAIVKELVTTLGGTIEAKSEIDRGTTFIIVLPES